MTVRHSFAKSFPLLCVSPYLSPTRLRKLHEESFSESMKVEEALLVMLSKAMEMTRLLSLSINGTTPEIELACHALGRDIHQQEKKATEAVVESDLEGDLLKSIVQFPVAMERIGDFLESILKCFRMKNQEHFTFSETAHAELNEIFARLLDIMNDLRDVLITPNEVLLEHLVVQGQTLRSIIRDCRSAHWKRMEASYCSPQASSAFLDILDSAGSINAYLQTVCFALHA